MQCNTTKDDPPPSFFLDSSSRHAETETVHTAEGCRRQASRVVFRPSSFDEQDELARYDDAFELYSAAQNHAAARRGVVRDKAAAAELTLRNLLALGALPRASIPTTTTTTTRAASFHSYNQLSFAVAALTASSSL